MPQLLPENPPATVYAQPWAVRFGFALVAGLTLIVGFAFYDTGHRTELEAVSETTAVGDKQFFVLPEADKLPVVGAMLDGKPLYVTTLKQLDLKDTHTKRVGEDKEHGLTIYTLADSALPAERDKLGKKGGGLLLKTAVNQYVPAESAAK